MASEEEMANLQRLSSGYEPEVTGPLVSQRLLTQAIVDEYAQADPIYVTKTKVLADKFPMYRTLKGDGNCGWRALAFGYFETLLSLGDLNRIRREMDRLQGFNALIDSIGYEEYLYIEFVQQTLDLLEEIAINLSSQDIRQTLLDRFNDDAVSNAIITHFRLITSGWMKSRAHLYKDFLLDGTIDQYRAAYIDPFQVQIEHLGMQACIDAILKPVGIAVDVTYLDRSNLGEANTIRSPADLLNGCPTPTTLSLLYRPGHYDILYSSGSSDPFIGWMMPPPPEDTIDLGINSSFGQVIYNDIDLSAIPGFSSLNLNPILDHIYTPSPSFHDCIYPPTNVPLDPTPAENLVPSVGIHNHPAQGDNFRHSPYQASYQEMMDYARVSPCQTPAMKQAGEDVAHYRHRQFQPIEWKPESDYTSWRGS